MAILDQVGSFFNMGGETEEERRRREEEERLKAEAEATPTPFKQTIVTDPVTGKQTMKMEGDVKDFSAANPNTPTVTGPAVPTEMGPPRSAMNEQPNFFGELYNARMNDLNKRVDQTVGMFKDPEAYARERFAGVTQAVDDPAAYARQRLGVTSTAPAQPAVPTGAPTAPTMEGIMAGPPREAMMPPETPAQPVPAGQPPKSKAQLAAESRQAPTGTTAPTAEGLAMGPSIADAQPEAWESKIQAAKTNPQALAAINSDSRAPDWAKSLAADELGTTILRQRQEQQAEQKLNTIVQNQGKGFERAIKDPSEEGSVFRAYLYARFGLNDLAKQEQQKLGAGDTYMQIDLPGGGKASVKFSDDGMAKSGIDHATGKPIGRDVLQTLHGLGGGGGMLKGAQTSSRRVRDQQGTEWSVVQTPQGPIFYDNNRRRGTPTGKTVDIGIGSDLDLAYQKEMISARAKLETLKASERIKTYESLNAVRAKEGKPLFSLSDLGLNAAGEFVSAGSQATQNISTQYGGTAQPAPATAAQPAKATTAAQPAATTTATGPVPPTPVRTQPAPAAATTTPEAETTGAIERKAEAQKEIVKKASEFASQQANIIKDLNAAKDNIKILESGRTNFGTIIGGTLPGERAIGKAFETPDAIRTKNVLEYVNKINAANVKALGTNPTDTDLRFVTDNTPNETWNEKDVINWIKRSEKGQRNSLRIAREVIRTGGAYEEPVPAEDTGEVDTNNPLLKKKKK